MNKNGIIFTDLRAEMARRDIRIKDLAKELDVTRDTMGLKLSGKSPLKLDEAFKINRKFFPDKSIWVLFKELNPQDNQCNCQLKIRSSAHRILGHSVLTVVLPIIEAPFRVTFIEN